MPNGRSVGVLPAERRRSIPDNLWCRCPGCSEMLFTKEVEENHQVCPSCGFHFPLSAAERIDILCRPGSFQLIEEGDQWRFGTARIGKVPAVIFVCDHESEEAMRGFCHAVEQAISMARPLVGIYANSRSPRLPSAAAIQSLARLAEMALPYVVLLTQPSPEHGYQTSFPLGDILLAEGNGAQGGRKPFGANQPSVPGQNLLDRIVERKECADLLRTVLAFLTDPAGR